MCDEEAILQFDFAENYQTFQQDEIHAAHWNYQQITVFTACSKTKNGTSSYAIISDELSHDKIAVWHFLKEIIKSVLKKNPNVKKISVFSDGCVAQFKNKCTLSNLLFSESDLGIQMRWFFLLHPMGKVLSME